MRKALLVGINKYATAGSDLQGCVNDVTNVRDILLKYYGFTVPDIRVLTDDRATKVNIIERLGWLIAEVSAGDNIVFHFSGHGSQIRDRNGDELKDGLDEIICPHDMDWDGTFIADDELAGIFRQLPQGVTLDVILDSCHSGTGTRNSPYLKPRFLRPPMDILCRNEDDLTKRGIFSWLSGLFSTPADDDKPIAKMNHALFAGCRDNQYSADAEIDGTPNGAFTYFFCKHIRVANGVITRSVLKNRVKDSLKHNGFEQVPQLEAPKAMFNIGFGR
jgi:hypothetical protein